MSRLSRLNIHVFTVSSLIGLASCGAGGGNSKVASSFSTSALISEEHPISEFERAIATRICYAYQSKSKNFRTYPYLGGTFNFNASSSDCKNKKNSYLINTHLNFNNSNVLSYLPISELPAGATFYDGIQTDTSGYLSQICDKIKNNLTVNNTTLVDTVKVQISFFRENLDGFFLQYFTKQADNSYKIESAEKFKVRTQFDYVTGQILGMDEFYSTQKVCASTDANSNSDYTQNFMP